MPSAVRERKLHLTVIHSSRALISRGFGFILAHNKIRRLLTTPAQFLSEEALPPTNFAQKFGLDVMYEFLSFFSRPLFVSLYVFFFLVIFNMTFVLFFCADAERDFQ